MCRSNNEENTSRHQLSAQSTDMHLNTLHILRPIIIAAECNASDCYQIVATSDGRQVAQALWDLFTLTLHQSQSWWRQEAWHNFSINNACSLLEAILFVGNRMAASCWLVHAWSVAQTFSRLTWVDLLEFWLSVILRKNCLEQLDDIFTGHKSFLSRNQQWEALRYTEAH